MRRNSNCFGVADQGKIYGAHIWLRLTNRHFRRPRAIYRNRGDQSIYLYLTAVLEVPDQIAQRMER
jgi:hypothetical protein